MANAMNSEAIKNSIRFDIAMEVSKSQNIPISQALLEVDETSEDFKNRLVDDVYGLVNEVAGYVGTEQNDFKKDGSGSSSKTPNEKTSVSTKINAPLPDKMITIKSSENNSKAVIENAMGMIYGSSDLIGPSTNALFDGRHSLQTFNEDTGQYDRAQNLEYYFDPETKVWTYSKYKDKPAESVEGLMTMHDYMEKEFGDKNNLGKQKFILESMLQGRIEMKDSESDMSSYATNQVVSQVQNQLDEINLAIEQERQIDRLAREKAYIESGINDPDKKLDEYSLSILKPKEDGTISKAREDVNNEVDKMISILNFQKSKFDKKYTWTEKEKAQYNRMMSKLNVLKSDDKVASKVMRTYGRYANEYFTTENEAFSKAVLEYIGDDAEMGIGFMFKGERKQAAKYRIEAISRSGSNFKPKSFEQFEDIDETLGEQNESYKGHYNKAKADIETELSDNFLNMSGYKTFATWSKTGLHTPTNKQIADLKQTMLTTAADGAIDVEMVSDGGDLDAGFNSIKTGVSFREYRDKIKQAPEGYSENGKATAEIGYRFDENGEPQTIMTITKKFKPSSSTSGYKQITRTSVMVIPGGKNGVFDVSDYVPSDEIQSAQSYGNKYISASNNFISRSAMPSVPARFLPNVDLFKDKNIREGVGEITFEKESKSNNDNNIQARVIWKKPDGSEEIVAVNNDNEFNVVLSIFATAEKNFKTKDGYNESSIKGVNGLLKEYFNPSENEVSY
jgi:hypothetical protein